MECSQGQWISNEQYIRQFELKIIEQRIPISGSMDLTHRCNLHCSHCYIGPHPVSSKVRNNELTTAQILSIIDDVTKAGCLYMLFTGGEPLLRKDFREIYYRAKTNGLLVTIFSNGTLIEKRIIELLRDYPPLCVDITLYGASEATYEKITGVPGSFQRCMWGLRQLRDHNIPFKLKTVLITHNHHELSSMENLAKDFGVGFRLDSAIFPRLDGDRTPLQFRISPEEAVNRELTDEERNDGWRKFSDRIREVPPSDDLYPCGAGVSHFHIDPYGKLQPCLMVKRNPYDLLKGHFMKGWSDSTVTIRRLKLPSGNKCRQCSIQSFCGYCPGFFDLETGAEDLKSEFLCAMGHLRYERMKGSGLCQR